MLNRKKIRKRRKTKFGRNDYYCVKTITLYSFRSYMECALECINVMDCSAFLFTKESNSCGLGSKQYLIAASSPADQILQISHDWRGVNEKHYKVHSSLSIMTTI